jgi:hypothetical protein
MYCTQIITKLSIISSRYIDVPAYEIEHFLGDNQEIWIYPHSSKKGNRMIAPNFVSHHKNNDLDFSSYKYCFNE